MSKLVVTDEQRAIGEEIIGRYFVELGVHKQKDIQDSIATAIAKSVEEAVELERAKLLAGVTGVWVDTLRQRGKRDE